MAKSTRISTTCDPTQQSRRIGGAGDSSQTVPYRKQSKRSDRTANALQRVTQTLGTAEVARFRELWNQLENVEREHAQADGIIMALIKRGLSQIETRLLLKIGGPRFQRIAAAVEEGASLETFGTRRERPTPKHAATQEDLNVIHAQALTFSLEDGFPCSHRRPIQYFTDPATTWMGLHAEYAIVQQAIGARVLSQSRWRQYIGFFYPGLRLTRSKEDACNACVRLDIQPQRDDLPVDERTRLELEKAMHLNSAIEQRRFVSKLAKDYISRNAPEQTVPEIIIDDVLQELTSTEGRHLEGASIEAVATAQATPRSPRIQMQIEEYGGSFALPHYGYERPSADYFQSNLMMQNFIIADLTSGVDRVVLYDERGQGKGADALCSLRLRHHLVLAKQDSPPEILFMVLDNCVGQNKSQ